MERIWIPLHRMRIRRYLSGYLEWRSMKQKGMQTRPPWTLRKAGRGRNIRDSCTFDAQNAGKRRVFLPDRKQIIIIVVPVEPVGLLKSP